MPLKVAVVGMGYVGLTLSAALAKAGHTVYGVDAVDSVVDALSVGRPHIHEPDLAEVFQTIVGSTVFVSGELPTDVWLDAVMLSVSTPVDSHTHIPYLENLRDATRQVAARVNPDALVVVRSTVPIGTTRNLVLPILQEAWGSARVCMAPERTIQGQALRELVDLPQVVGGLDQASLAAGVEVFSQLAHQVVPVSSLETAEMVKLSNNCHTDLIYGFGNEIALIASQHGIDPLEVLNAANVDYPRPNLSKPGFVGGACLTKDPYIMMTSSPERAPFLVGRARELNEYMPLYVAQEVIGLLAETRGDAEGATLAIMGWACKGNPPTDDMRGNGVESMLPLFADAGIAVIGHDPMVRDEVILGLGGTPLPLDRLVPAADGLLVINDHPDYLGLDLTSFGAVPPVVYDAWRVLDDRPLRAAGTIYAGLGYRADRVGNDIAIDLCDAAEKVQA